MINIFSLLLSLLNNAYFISYIKSKTFDLPLTFKEEQFYLQKKCNGDKVARDLLIEKNLRLVAHIAKKYNNNRDLQEDLISIGTIGLIKAIDSYSIDKKTKLATYASKCIENEILMNIRSNKKNKMQVSLQDPIGVDKEGNAISLIDILGTDVDYIVDKVELKMKISKLYEKIEQILTERENEIIKLRYGLTPHGYKTQREIAQKLNISRSYVSRIEKKALKKLKKELKIEKTNSETLQATINPSDATDDKTLTWKSEDENIAKVDGNGKVTGVGTGTTNITVTTSNGKSATCKVTVVKQTPSVNYSTHVQDIGWQGYVKDGSTAGTTGQSKRLEAIRIKLSNNTSYKGTIQYQTHIQDIGWQGWKMNDEMSGTSGQSKRLEAIRIKLTDELAENYDIYYRVHAQEFGWLGWAKNGESAGTAGYSYRLEAIEVKLVEKDGKAPGSTQDAYRQRYVSYQTHVQDIGWQGIKYDGDVAGTSGQSKRLEAINISLSNPLYSGSIEYQTHVQDIGWQGWKANGQMAGTSGQSKRLEAIRIKLTGEMAKQYDIYYRVHSQEFGWLGWAKNGESAGTEGYSYRLEAIQIQLVKKGGSAPGSTSNCFYKR